MESALWMLKESAQCLENTALTCGVWNLPIKFSFRPDDLRVDKPKDVLPKCLLMTLMECKSTQRHQKGFKSGESGKSSDVASYIKSHTLNSRGAEAGRNVWRLSHPDLKWNIPIYRFARTQNGTQTSHHYHLTKNHGGPKEFIGKEEVGIMRWDLQTSLRVLAHPRLNVLQPQQFGL